MLPTLSDRPIYIPKDAYLDRNMLTLLQLCDTQGSATAEELTQRLIQAVPGRAHLVGEHEATRDRLDFLSYCRLVAKERTGRYMQYRRTLRGTSIVEALNGSDKIRGEHLLAEALLQYTTANDAYASATYAGHTVPPFRMLLEFLLLLGRDAAGQATLRVGIPKKILAHLIGTVRRSGDSLLFPLRHLATALKSGAPDQYLERLIFEAYSLQPADYWALSTNLPARLMEWPAKLGLISVEPGKLWSLASSIDLPARAIRRVYGISPKGEQLVRSFADLTGRPMQTYGAYNVVLHKNPRRLLPRN